MFRTATSLQGNNLAKKLKYGFAIANLFLFIITNSAFSQSTIEPNSITLGIDQINMVDEDTILHWGKNRSAFRGGFFRSADITNANTGQYSFAYGNRNNAEGEASFAVGSLCNAKQEFSIAMGSANTADGADAIALGNQNHALFGGAIAIGNKNIANTRNSIALGNNLIVNNSNTVAVGTFNVDIAPASSVELSPIFVVGNGDGRDIGRSNAITVLGDGRMGLRTSSPESDIHLVHQNGDHEHGFRIENEANGNWWRLYSRSAFNELELYNLTSGPQSAVGKFDAMGVYMNLSDKRLKKDIVDLPYGLSEVLQLTPKRYQFKHGAERNEIGLIAQEVIKFVPELVNYDEERDKYMMNYDGFGVLSIKAIQELNEVVEKQSETIEYQQSIIEELIKRVELLEDSK